jgi:hypothetical protein
MATPFPRLTLPQFASPGLGKPLYGLANRRLQPERYTKAQFDFNIYIRFKYFLFLFPC